MTEPKKPLTEKQKTVVDFVLRKIGFSKAWEDESLRKDAMRRAAVVLRNPKIGDVVPGGDVYAGVSPDTGRRMYARVEDEETVLSFNAAAARAKELSLETGKAYRVPSIEELKILFNHHAAVGGFKTTDDSPNAWYGSSTPAGGYHRKCYDFSSKILSSVCGIYPLSMRLVRD